jgi:hypothetical protein
MTIGPKLSRGGILKTLTIQDPLNYWTQVLPGQVVFGLGLATLVAPLTAAILGAVPSEEAGSGSAVNNAVARIAGLISIAFAGVIVGPAFTREGLYNALLVTAGLFLFGAVVSAVGIRNPVQDAATAAVSEPGTASDDGGPGGQVN